MATITSLGTGSGLALETLVTKLMAAESVSLTTLQAKQASYQTKISAMGSLRNALSSLQTSSQNMTPSLLQSASQKFASYSASIADTTIASATASTGAVAGSYSLEVSKLAQGQRLQSAAITNSNTSITSTGGTLTLSLGTLNGSTYTADTNRTYALTLSAGATLANLRDAINGSGAGVTATIVNGSSGSQLVLTGADGTNNVMKLTSSTTSGSSDIAGFDYDPVPTGTHNLTQTAAAQDAEFKLNGISATSNSNTVSNVLDGVTLQLTATTNTPTTLKITQDFSSNIKKALDSFVSAYNSAYSTMSSLGAYNPDTKVAGNLQGNSTLRYAMGQIRQTLFGTTSGNATSSYQTLSNIGVSVSDSGTLSIDSAKLNAAISADSTTVSNLVGNVGKAFDSTIENLIGTTGSVTTATNGLNATVKDFDNQQTKLQDRLSAIETRYRTQFAALDTLVSSLTSTGDFLTSYITRLNSSSK